tara:strand:- start:4823 stop:4963 length:141 start_codon:yes stop_codon:yes gene_type:complete
MDNKSYKHFIKNAIKKKNIKANEKAKSRQKNQIMKQKCVKQKLEKI